MSDAAGIKFEGGCSCGAVRYEVRSALTDCGYCHCRMCQMASGAPVLIFASAALDAFTVTRGTPRKRRSSGFGERWHCAECGTPLAMRVDYEPDSIDIAVISLDAPAVAPPQFHIWTQSAVDWFDIDDTLPRFARARPGHAP
jgi:hypothetical protein